MKAFQWLLQKMGKGEWRDSEYLFVITPAVLLALEF